MFSSNLVQHPSSIHVFNPSSTSLFDLETDGVHFNHQHHYHHHYYHHNNQFVNGDYYFHAYNSTLVPHPVITDNNIMVRQQQLCNGPGFLYNNSLLGEVKKKVTNMKKDGHSKIHTAQGPRDRRVRMSIDVAKKFFYLQDILGFDKASKTLDWLFTKSKTAIKELIEEMKQCSSPGATDQCEVVFQEILKRRADEEEEKGQKKMKSASKCVDAKKKRKYRSVVDVNQSRAEARARARERTKEKMQNKRFDESKKEYNERTSVLTMEPKLPMSSSMLYGNYQHNVHLANDLSSHQIKYTSFLNMH